jgi:tetratricopeptide (TPR) repeat protein
MAAKRFAKPKKQYLPLSKSTFSKLVEGNCIYVDKTRYIHPMVERGGAYFLSRPRRFGKSLMVSVLKEIFQGNRAIFKGYWIYDRIAWEKYPVIHLDFLGIDHRTLGIEKAIANKLDRIAKEYATQCNGDSISEKFFDLIENLAREKETVVLVDEYDKPITDCLEDIKIAAYNRDILRNFYSVLKSQEGKIKFLFMTGISRFTRISIFSELNHLTDITFHKDYSNLLGYTDTEIELYFDAYIHEWLQLHQGSSKTQLMEKLKDYYNGYSWNGKDFVYNPFSINHFFNNMEFKNYWFASGTTTSLVKMVKEKGSAVENWEHLEVREQFFDKFDIADININLMLFQTGYLTVKKRLDDAYVLSYPNREVEYALLNNLMEVYSGRSLEDAEKLIKEIKESLEKKQIDSFIHQMKAFIASIPYNLVEADAERFYHLVFYLVLKLLIGKVSPEKYTNLGRIDTVVETGSFIYVIEFKMGSADEAFKQILEKKYYEQYLAQPKAIILFGIGFSVEDRNISAYKSIELSREDLPVYKRFPNAVNQLTEKVNNPEGFKKAIAAFREIAERGKAVTADETGTIAVAAIPPVKISLAKLPVTGDQLFGREKELQLLDEAWTDSHTRIVILVAWGGMGKTALVNRWLNEMQAQDYRDAHNVYGWSFYSQGAAEGKQASADEFFQETLLWFGDPLPGIGSAVDKGSRLARLTGQHKSLIILDGLEPLQFPPGEVQEMAGKLKDPGLAAFLKELAVGQSGQAGLCVITSRHAVTDLESRRGFAVKEILLEHLSEAAGVKLLKSLGVTTGSAQDFRQALQEYDCHPLALTLLGNYIKSVHQGDLRRRDEIPQLSKERLQGRHAGRVMAAYEKWLGPSPERDILYIMGLFDRPVEPGAIAALRKEPTIPGVTDRLQKISEEDWQWALSHLRGARLVAAENPHKPGLLDSHPLVREYFGARLRQENPIGWQAAHERLYRYYQALPGKEVPDTLAEMEPLLAAVVHGCAAGLHQDALLEVYLQRISTGEKGYTAHKFGAFGAELAVLSHFFEKPWSQPTAGLADHDKAYVLSMAGFTLRAVGRLQEALQPMKAAFEIHIEQKNWSKSARDASNLSELLLTLGRAEEAVDYARQSTTHADQSGDVFLKVYMRTTLADALHQSGQSNEAEQLFREAEALQKKRQPAYRYLYSLSGYRYCDLLLGQGKVAEVIQRAEDAIKIARRERRLLAIALDTLTLGRAWMMPVVNRNTGGLSTAEAYWHQAVEGLRKSGDQDFLALSLIYRAEGFRYMKDYARARDDLSEALDIAELGSMKLFICDYHLEAGRLCRAEGKEKEAKEHFQTAKKLIEETGYYRRYGEI